MELFLGTAKIDITPETPVPLAGFALRDNQPYERVSEPIFARIAFFRQTDPAGSCRRALLVSADLIWWGSERMEYLRAALSERFGLQPDSALLHGTHSHSGPQTSSLFHPLLGEADREYLRLLEERLLTAVAEAAGNLEPVRLSRGEGQCAVNANRRTKINGSETAIDRELLVYRFEAGAGRTKALFVHYACHPVVSVVNEVSPECTGVAMNELERRLGDGATCLFLQGCCGDINPIFPENGPFSGRDAFAVREYGHAIAAAALDALDAPMRPLSHARLDSERRILNLPLQPLPTREELLEVSRHAPPPVKEWAERLSERCDSLPDRLPLDMTLLRLSDGLALLSMNAEVVVEYGLFLKQSCNGRVLPLPYTNGMFGYLPTRRQLSEGGYEPDTSRPYFMMPAKLSDRTEEIILAEWTEWLGSTYKPV